jgi:hypothetical protein
MASVLPATGTAISMGRMGAAYYNGTPTTQVSVGNTAATRHLNASIGRGVTTTTAISSVFGGRTAPFTY